MPVPTVAWKRARLKVIDQSLLPHRLKFIYCDTPASVWRIIRHMKVRGAPLLGVVAAYGVYLGVKHSGTTLFRDLERSIRYLSTSRPTARNLFWALERMRHTAHRYKRLPAAAIKQKLLAEAHAILEEDKRICRRIGRYGRRLIAKNDRVLTHCNAGGLATADYGTALGVLYAAHGEGKRITVYADETRPVLQGARLTTWELMREKIDTVLICDSMAAPLMAKGLIDKVIVGADRIAQNGDTANKIGTYAVAVLARHHGIPFYVAAPLSTIDTGIASGKEIPIEERGADEVRKICTVSIAPKNVRVRNPAFDVTPHRYITAIITEKGILRKPFVRSIKRVCG
jgi:methylthioribose-1-phosphate isomerase